jgi:magnesium transporter
MLTSFYYSPEGTLNQNLDEDAMRAAVRSGQGVLWVDLSKPTPDETFILDDVFAFHPLTIEDCQNVSQFPKLDEYSSYLFLVFLAPNPSLKPNGPARSGEGNANGDDPVREMDIYLGRNYVVTYGTTALPFLQTIQDRAKREPKRLLGRGATFLVHDILDAAVDQFFEMVGKFQAEAEEAEDRLQEPGTEELVSRVLGLKRRVLALRRQMSDHRETLQRLIRGNHPAVAPEALPYFRDILDHISKIEDDLDVCRDTIDMAREASLTLADVRINQAMKVLTVVFTLSLPLAIMTSWFGMNFKNLPLSDHEYGVWIYTGLMGLVCLALWYWIRRRKWM